MDIVNTTDNWTCGLCTSEPLSKTPAFNSSHLISHHLLRVYQSRFSLIRQQRCVMGPRGLVPPFSLRARELSLTTRPVECVYKGILSLIAMRDSSIPKRNPQMRSTIRRRGKNFRLFFIASKSKIGPGDASPTAAAAAGEQK